MKVTKKIIKIYSLIAIGNLFIYLFIYCCSLIYVFIIHWILLESHDLMAEKGIPYKVTHLDGTGPFHYLNENYQDYLQITTMT